MFSMNKDVINLFENKRKGQDISWEEISFISDEVLYSIGLKRKEDGILSAVEKEKLEQVISYNPKASKIRHLRKEATNGLNDSEKSACLKENLLNGTIIPLEKIKDDNGDSFIKRLKKINLEGYSSFYEYFATGSNIGMCGYTSRKIAVCYSDIFSNIECHSGILKIIAGTGESKKGAHKWIEVDFQGKRYIIDTSTMLMIPIELKNKIGYIDENKSYKFKDYIEFISKTNKTLSSEDEELLELIEKKDIPTLGKYSYNHYLNYCRALNKPMEDNYKSKEH